MDENTSTENKVAEKTPEQMEEEMVVAEINTVLEKHGYGLKPFMIYHDTGVFPAVKPTKLSEPKEEVGQDIAAKI